MLVEQIEELAAPQAQHRGGLALREAALFEPAQHRGDKHLAPKARRFRTQDLDGIVWHFDCDLHTHGCIFI